MALLRATFLGVGVERFEAQQADRVPDRFQRCAAHRLSVSNCLRKMRELLSFLPPRWPLLVEIQRREQFSAMCLPAEFQGMISAV